MYGKVYGDALDSSPPSATSDSTAAAGYCTSFVALANSSGDRSSTGDSLRDDKNANTAAVSSCARAMLRDARCVGGDGYFSHNALQD